VVGLSDATHDASTSALGETPLDDGVPGSTNALVVLSRHAGPGDSLLLVHTLMNRDQGRPFHPAAP
jgi:hypothetical protein